MHQFAATVLIGMVLAPSLVLAEDKPAAPLARAELDERIFKELRNVINRGATIHNNGDVAGCYRIYQGALLVIAPLLDHRPALQKQIASGLRDADQMPEVAERASALRAVLDAVRAELKPPVKTPPKEPAKDK
jgi:hypothetical protein